MRNQKYMDINLEQQKLISSPLRSKIIYLLDEKSMTAKQVADEMGRTAGSIHYHIQQLFNGGFLEIEETKENKGIIEKYYRSKATHFRLKDENSPDQGMKKHSRRSCLSLSDDELKDFEADFDALLLKYYKKTVKEDIPRTPYQIECQFEIVPEEEE
ncbi:putative ArsR family transcriptional regulator [Cytobacillus eiseniae]|uniref:ArsR family transcriptional regulator n=1 Tax=Cytobacillus eiseniae TaxID=762947 RepID=A0ABS4RI02_9BACI|nr:winged helix-turn-helix domain-containing protein [Cytobacillus eiseniae]MBP2241934.1 putative ArsR family transcriptional regulator [Cytobacillus eiseniae]